MKPFGLLVAIGVWEFLERLPRAEQLNIRERFLQIREFPSNFSDYRESDPIGRQLEINILGRVAIKYWIDHADRHVKILDLHFADRRR
jgi:hypothetical protein